MCERNRTMQTRVYVTAPIPNANNCENVWETSSSVIKRVDEGFASSVKWSTSLEG